MPLSAVAGFCISRQLSFRASQLNEQFPKMSFCLLSVNCASPLSLRSFICESTTLLHSWHPWHRSRGSPVCTHSIASFSPFARPSSLVGRPQHVDSDLQPQLPLRKHRNSFTKCTSLPLHLLELPLLHILVPQSPPFFITTTSPLPRLCLS